MSDTVVGSLVIFVRILLLAVFVDWFDVCVGINMFLSSDIIGCQFWQIVLVVVLMNPTKEDSLVFLFNSEYFGILFFQEELYIVTS